MNRTAIKIFPTMLNIWILHGLILHLFRVAGMIRCLFADGYLPWSSMEQASASQMFFIYKFKGNPRLDVAFSSICQH